MTDAGERRTHMVKNILAVLAGGFLVAAPAGGFAAAAELAQPSPTAPVAKKLNPDLVNLPPNTWVHIKPDRNPEGRAYAGVCWGNGLISYFGGHHRSYACNDVELYDVAANKWIQATEPEDWRDYPKWTHLTPEQAKFMPNFDNQPGNPYILSPKGRPLTYHTYQDHVWFPEEQAFYHMMKTYGLWAFDPVKREWALVTKELPPFPSRGLSGLYYDPGLKTIFAIVTAESGGAYAFDREKKTWALKCKLPSNVWTEVQAAYDSTRKVHVVHTQGKWHDLDMATATLKPIKALEEAMKAAGITPIPSLAENSMAYDPESKQTLVIVSKNSHRVGNPITLWAYDAGKDDWSEVKMAGPSPTGFTAWGLLVYDTDHKCCLLVNVQGDGGSKRQGGPVNGLYAFKYKPEGRK
jgi:hypothetical protein